MRIIFLLFLLTLTSCGFDQGIQREYIISDVMEDVTDKAIDEDL